MSAPAGGGRTFTLTPGRVGVCLTEHASGDDPVTVINTSGNRAWLGSDSSVGPSNGVPLDAYTSIPWSGSGQLWAAADAAATVPVSVTVTTAIDNWAPSPVTLATQTARQLAASGVPNVLLATTLFQGNAPTSTAGPAICVADISGYASLVLSLRSTTLETGMKIEVRQYLGGLGGVVVDDIYLSGAQNRAGVYQLAALGDTIQLAQFGGSAAIRLVGTNRAASSRLDARSGYNTLDTWSSAGASTAFVAGTTYPLSQSVPAAGQVLQGTVYGLFSFGGAAGTAKGQFVAVDEVGGSMVIADSGEPGTYTSANGGAYLAKMLALPPNYRLSYTARAAYTGQASVTLAAASGAPS